MSEKTTETLARFAASLTLDAIPARTQRATKALLLDALACALAGHQGEETVEMAALASALAQSNESSIIGGGHLSLAGATLLNGYLITAVTMCDTHRATLTHITPEVVPPALAIAERDDASGRRPAGRARRRLRDHDPHRPRPRLSGIPQARLAWAGRRSARSARRRRSGGCAASTPKRWPARSAWPAASPPAPSPPGARRRSSSTNAAARCPA